MKIMNTVTAATGRLESEDFDAFFDRIGEGADLGLAYVTVASFGGKIEAWSFGPHALGDVANKAQFEALFSAASAALEAQMAGV